MFGRRPTEAGKVHLQKQPLSIKLRGAVLKSGTYFIASLYSL